MEAEGQYGVGVEQRPYPDSRHYQRAVRTWPSHARRVWGLQDHKGSRALSVGATNVNWGLGLCRPEGRRQRWRLFLDHARQTEHFRARVLYSYSLFVMHGRTNVPVLRTVPEVGNTEVAQAEAASQGSSTSSLAVARSSGVRRRQRRKKRSAGSMSSSASSENVFSSLCSGHVGSLCAVKCAKDPRIKLSAGGKPRRIIFYQAHHRSGRICRGGGTGPGMTARRSLPVLQSCGLDGPLRSSTIPPCWARKASNR